ncbi:MAG: hypothetical protein ACNFW9_01155 [Candidatus Kerfeldbacteria bacterium]
MKNTLYKKIFQISIIIIAILIFVPQTAKAELGDLDVVFSHDPLFFETGIVPGDTASETITVTNNSTEEKTIGIKFIGTSTFDLDDQILFEIFENGNIIYGGSSDPKSLANLLDLGEISLIKIQKSETKTLTINADFPTSVGNPYQLKSSIFNIQIGYILPKILGDETEIKYPIETKKPIVLGVELPVTGGQLLLIFIVALILLTVTVIVLRLTIAKTKNNS